MPRVAVVAACLFLMLLPVSVNGEPPGAPPADASGFICRTIPDRSIAVVSPLTGGFAKGMSIRFFDDTGALCGTGIVQSAYSDLAYVAIDNCPVERLKKGFIASAGSGDNEAKMLCGFSMNLPMVIERGKEGGHSVPPNVVRIKYNDNSTKPVYFRHFKHDMACVTCHHREIDTPCKSCHPVKRGKEELKTDSCLREICTSCHKEHKDRTSECAWCHKDKPPGPGGAP
jgi:hypothetical protein